VRIAWNTQVESVANVRSQFKAVIAGDLGRIVYKLIFLLFLVERAVALVCSQRIAKICAAVAINEKCR
jgi:hypothetical protein